MQQAITNFGGMQTLVHQEIQTAIKLHTTCSKHMLTRIEFKTLCRRHSSQPAHQNQSNKLRVRFKLRFLGLGPRLDQSLHLRTYPL